MSLYSTSNLSELCSELLFSKPIFGVAVEVSVGHMAFLGDNEGEET